MDIFVFQPHIVSNLQSLRISLFLLNCFFIISCAAFIVFVASSQLLSNLMRNSSGLRNSVFTIRFPFHRCLPKLSSNRFVLLLYVFCYYMKILQLLTILSNCLVSSWHSVTWMSYFLINSFCLSICLRVIHHWKYSFYS